MTLAEQHLKFWDEHLTIAPNFVYVIQGDPGGPIKIGVATNPRKRLSSLQTGNPQRLRLLHVVPGDHALEAAFHQRLADAVVLGEWFAGPEAEEFLNWIWDFAQKAIADYEDTGRLPTSPPPKRRRRSPGMAAGAYNRPTVKGWRTTDEQDHRCTVRHVKPTPMTAEEKAARIEKLRMDVRLGRGFATATALRELLNS